MNENVFFLVELPNLIPSEFEHLLTYLAAIYMSTFSECTKYDKYIIYIICEITLYVN